MYELAVGSVESSGWVVIVVSKPGRTGVGHEDISCLAGEPPASPPHDLGPWGKDEERPVTHAELGVSPDLRGSSLLGTSEDETQVWPRCGNPNFQNPHLHGAP